MPQYVPNFLCLLFSVLPALLFRPMKLKRFVWLFLLYAVIGAILPDFSLLTLFCALMLTFCLYWSVYQPTAQGKLISFFLCWNGCVSVLDVSRFLRPIAASGPVFWLVLAILLCLGLAFGLMTRWFSRWSFEDALPLSSEQRTSPLPLLLISAVLLLILTVLGNHFPLGCAVSAAILEVFSLLTIGLWNDVSLAILHSRESGDGMLQPRQAMDRAALGSNIELLRRLTESNDKLMQAGLAYRNGNHALLSELLETPCVQETISYSAFPLLDAVLRNSAVEARKAEMQTDFRLQIGGLNDFALADIGVLLDLMLGLLCEYHPGTSDTLRLRMQEWGDSLILTAGRRDCLRGVPDEKIRTIRRIADEYSGWTEFAEKEKGICLSVVLFRPSAGK